jgi:hypothetical protein
MDTTVLRVMCFSVESQLDEGRPCVVLCYHVNHLQDQLRDIKEVTIGTIQEILTKRGREEPRRYPTPPVNITVTGDVRTLVADKIRVTKFVSKGSARVDLYIYHTNQGLDWVAGKELHIKSVSEQI